MGKRVSSLMSQTFVCLFVLALAVPLYSDGVKTTPSTGSGEKQPTPIASALTEEDPESLPYFDRNATIITNMTVQMGTDVTLSCPVNRLGDKMVSWLKRDDKADSMKLLTYDRLQYSPDPRHSVHVEGANIWQLRLSTVKRSDGGAYQCQVSTHPPIILSYFLDVVAPTVEIVDDGEKPLKDKIFKTGSTLELRCIVGQVGPEISQHVNWYHGARLLNNDTYRGGISVKSWVRKEFGVSKLSKLYVANVNKTDSGLYTCSLGRFGNATVFVSVLNGETPAAMQHGEASHHVPVSLLIFLLGFLLISGSSIFAI